jgi:putative SOS response-associated peptidase YedK
MRAGTSRMCGRFTPTWEEWRRVAEALRIDDDSDVAASYRARFNIAPTDQHFIVTSEFDVEGCNAHDGVWSIGVPPTTGAPASALTPRPRHSNSGRPFVKPSSSAAVSSRLTVFTTRPAPRASANRYGFTRAPAT